ncbi:MAG TPA: hypothetical protein VF092_11505 [Longimicrobium sp.]
MKDRLRLTLYRDSDYTGELRVEASGGGFAGVGSAWFDFVRLREFAEALGAFPLPGDPVKLEGGFWDAGELYQCHVSIYARQVDRRGAAAIRVALATEMWKDGDPERQNRVALEIPTDYASLQRLSRDMQRLVAGEVDEAVLETSP